MKKVLMMIVSAILPLSLVLSACGENQGAGQTLRVNIRTEPFSLHPGLANDSVSSSVLMQTFEGLTRINREGKPEPAMAEEIEVSDDFKTYTFHLREGVQWSNGDPVTAHDFEYAWKWVLDPERDAQYAYQLYYLKNAEKAKKGEVSMDEVGVEALDDQTLKVTLENPTPFFKQLTAFYTYYPINSKIAKENPDWHTEAGEQYTTNGPFKLMQWEHQNQIVLEKNENYWDQETVQLQRIEMYMVNDSNTELTMFDNGELDWAGMPTGELPVDAIPSLEEKGILNTPPIAGVYWYKFNTEKEPFTNEKIRKAFAYAIDREVIVKEITKSGEIPAMAAVPPTMIPENEKGYFKDHNVEKAKELLQQGLDELGYASVEDLPPITLSYNTLEKHAKIAQAVQDMWRKHLGIEVELENVEWNVYIEKLHQGDFIIGRLGWLGDFNDPVNFLELYKEKGGNNDTRWTDPQYQELLDKAAMEADEKKRLEFLRQAEAILMDEMPIAPIYFYTNPYVKKDYLKDVHITGLGNVQYKWAHIEQ